MVRGHRRTDHPLTQASGEVFVSNPASRTFTGGHHWLTGHGTRIDLPDDPARIALMTEFIKQQPALWFEDIGEPTTP